MPALIHSTLDATSGNRFRVESLAETTAPSEGREVEPATLERLQQLGRYIILGKLGAGGMSVVYEAYDPELDRKVALKILHGGPGAVSTQGRLLREGQALARITHANVVRVYDVGLDQGRLFIAMERIEGVTLREWLASARRSLAELLRVFISAGRGLAEAHAVGIVHRDFKPENALIDATGTLRIVDFGLARALTEDLAPEAETPAASPVQGLPVTQVGAIVGTLAYMAPEQLAGASVDARVDIFAFCVTLFEALYGVRPFAGETPADLRASIQRGPSAPPAGRASTELHALIVRGLAADPAARWPTIAALTDRLQALARPPRRRAAALALLVTGVAAGAFAVLPNASAPCSGVDGEIASTWGPGIAASVGEALQVTDGGLVDATWRRVLPQLAGYAERWSGARIAVCEAREQGAVSERLHDLELACLESRRAALAATVAVIRRRGASMVDELEAVVEGLPDLASCRDPARVQIRWAPPDDPAAAARVAAIEGRLVDAEASMIGGDVARAESLLRASAEELGGLPAPALLAELARVEGLLAGRLGRDEEMAEAQRRRLAASLEIGDHEAAGLAAAELVLASAADRGIAETWRTVAEALLAGPATPASARATLSARVGRAAFLRGDLEAALRASEEGLALAREEAAIPSTLRILLLEQALASSVTLGRFEGMTARCAELVEFLDDHRADGHPEQVKARMHVVEALLTLGDVAQASALVEEAEAALARGKITRRDLNFQLAMHRVVLAGMRGDLAALDAAAERALALADSPIDRLRLYSHLGTSYHNAGELERASAAFEAGIAEVGDDAPRALVLRRVEVQVTLGRTYLDAGRLDDAEAIFDAAIDVLSSGPDRTSFVLIEAKGGRGDVLLRRGNWAAARSELEQVLASIEGHDFPPGYIGNLHFALARATWGPDDRRPSPEDAARAREQATLALRDFKPLAAAQPTIAEIERWLAEHSAAKR